MTSAWTVVAFIYFAIMLLNSTSVADSYPELKSIIGYFTLLSSTLAPFFFFLILGRISELNKLVEKISRHEMLIGTVEHESKPQPQPKETPDKGTQEKNND